MCHRPRTHHLGDFDPDPAQGYFGRHQMTGAESLSPGVSPTVSEQRPAPAELLPRGSHMVPAG